MASAGRGKSKVVAGILGILLGGFGVHHYYLGSIGAGIVCLLLSCLPLALSQYLLRGLRNQAG